MLLRQIEYFQAVIENGNFYIAAEQCHVSQSAISQQIKKLEEELGGRIIRKTQPDFFPDFGWGTFLQKKPCYNRRYKANDKRNQTHVSLSKGYFWDKSIRLPQIALFLLLLVPPVHALFYVSNRYPV